MSALVHGSSVQTADIDTVARWSTANLQRLCDALNSVDAQIMIRAGDGPDGDSDAYTRMPGGLDPADLRHLSSFRVLTRDGDRIDFLQAIPVEPGDTGHRATYAELEPTALNTRLADDVGILLVSRDYLIRSKNAIGRPQDRQVVAELTAHTHPPRRPAPTHPDNPPRHRDTPGL